MTENTSNESTINQSVDINDNSNTEKFAENQVPNRPIVPINREVIREEMVKTAINFLLNPRVIESPLTQKRTFLLKKGLSLEEIDVAIDRCSRLTRNQIVNQSMDANNYSPHQSNGLQMATIGPIVQPMPSFLSRSSQFVSNVALFGGFLYGAYVFYKRYIEPFIFEKHRKPHPFIQIQQQLDQLSKAMDVLKDNMSSIETNIKKQIDAELAVRAPQDLTLHELKSELASIKALLVSRRQFTATPVGAIPLWQMNDNKDSNIKSDNQNDSEKLMNGSNESLENSNNENGFHDMTNGSVESVSVDGDQTTNSGPHV